MTGCSAYPPLLVGVRRSFRRINLWRQRSDNVRRREVICRTWLRNFLPLVLFKIFCVFAVVPHSHWLYLPGRSLDPVCKIRTGSHRSGYKRAPLTRRIPYKERSKCCHKLVRRSALDVGCSRCSDRLIQIAIRGGNLMLTLNFFLNQRRTWQRAKVSDKRRRELLLKVNLNRVL